MPLLTDTLTQMFKLSYILHYCRYIARVSYAYDIYQTNSTIIVHLATLFSPYKAVFLL